jgi:hypothetical protein
MIKTEKPVTGKPEQTDSEASGRDAPAPVGSLASGTAPPESVSGVEASLEAAASGVPASGVPASDAASGVPAAEAASGVPASGAASGVPASEAASVVPASEAASGVPATEVAYDALPTEAASGLSASYAASDEGPPSFRDLIRHFRRFRLIERILALALAVVLLCTKGWFFSLGALAGTVLLDSNLAVLQRVIDRSRPDRVEVPVWVTILKFYALFAVTAFVAFLVVYFRVGHPLAFLGGVLALVPALLLTVLWSGVEFLASLRRASGNA